MKNWTIARQVTGVAAVILALFFTVSTIAILAVRNMDSHADEAIQHLENALAGERLLQFAHRRFKVHADAMIHHTVDQREFETVASGLAEAKKTVSQMNIDAEQKSWLAATARADELFHTLFVEQVIPLAGKLATTRDPVERAKLQEQMTALDVKANELLVTYQTNAERLVSSLKTQAATDKRNYDRLVWLINVSVPGLALCALFFGGGLAFSITRNVSRRLRGVAGDLAAGSEQTAASAGQVSAASQSLAEGASEQAASLEQTSASLEQMTSMTQRNTDNAQKVNELARQARAAADQGAADMAAMTQAMDEIRTSSDDIAKIIKTIDEIAFQTNILALNAAVEAARAGEAGMGFAVVADEVRSLAQRAAQSARETSGKIDTAVNRTMQGAQLCERVARSLGEIVDKARQVDELAAAVATASREQSMGIKQVNAAMTQMDKVTQCNAASAEESASASEELNAQAAALQDAVTSLQQLVGRARGGNRPEAAQPQARPGPVPVKNAAWPAPHRGNGQHAAPRRAVTPVAVHRNGNGIPMPGDGDFQNF
jgi:truncated hemoglobin YjbI